MKNMRKLVGMMPLFIAVCVMTFAFMSATVAAQADAAEWWTGFTGWGLGALIAGVVVGIVIWMIWGEGERANVAKAAAMISIVIGAAAWLGVGATFEAPPAAVGAVQPQFMTTALAANNTTHGTVGVDAYSWSVLWDISDAAISTGDQLTLRFTLYRDDQLSGKYYTNAYVDVEGAPTFSTALVDDISIISKTGSRWDVTWTDSLGNDFINPEIPQVPQIDTTRETINCSITLNNNGIAGMVFESVSVATFDVILAETTTDSTGAIIAYSNPTTVPVTVIVTTQA